jgi:ribosomal protein L35
MSITRSLTKRIRITKNGKIVRRSMGVGHFRTRTTQRVIRNKRKGRSLDFPMKTLLNY